ncbi:MAG: Xaa-Pro peptidase family protein [Candidatus Lokiarchaeota archaeon]|nr:Xaa-Pro peptidase family protein [Candidatus Harpocratesius repetitus]
MNLFDRAQQLLEKFEIDGWLIPCQEGSDIHSEFMLDLEVHIRHYIFVSKDGNHRILTCTMEKAMVEKQLNNMGVDAQVEAYTSFDDIKTKLKPILSRSKIALDFGENVLSREGTSFAEYIPLGEYRALKEISPKTNFVSAAPIIFDLRTIKTYEDIQDLRETAKINLEILEDLPNWIKIGMTENEIKRKLEVKYLEYGGIAFPAIVANNANAADPHHNGSDKKIEKGVLLIDSGMKPHRMCSDITWTYWVGGEPSEDFVQAYQALLYSKEKSYEVIRAGLPMNLPAIKCREALTEKGYDHEKLYYHSLGHSLGFQVHDVGGGMRAKMPESYLQQENMVITNEPGLYWEGKWGVRLEDDLVIKKDGMEKLTYIPKDPLTI